MGLQNEFNSLYREIEKLVKRDQHNIGNDAKFRTLKKEILDIINTLLGDASRAYRVVKLTNSPATVVKVMNHIAAKTENNIATAVNM